MTRHEEEPDEDSSRKGLVHLPVLVRCLRAMVRQVLKGRVRLSWWIDGARQGSNREIEYRRQKRRVNFPYLTAAFSSSRWEFNPRSPVERGAKTAPLHAIVAGNLRRHTQRGFEYGVSYPHLSCDQRIA